MKVFFFECTFDGTIGGSHTCMYNLVRSLDMERFNVSVGFFQTNAYVNKFKDIGVRVHLIDRRPVSGGNVLIRKLHNWYRLVFRHRRELSEIVRDGKFDLVVLNNSIRCSHDMVLA